MFGLQHWDVSEGVVGDPEPVGQAIGAVHVLPVDGEAAPGEDGDHPVDDQQRGDVLPARLLRALVPGV